MCTEHVLIYDGWTPEQNTLLLGCPMGSVNDRLKVIEVCALNTFSSMVGGLPNRTPCYLAVPWDQSMIG